MKSKGGLRKLFGGRRQQSATTTTTTKSGIVSLQDPVKLTNTDKVKKQQQQERKQHSATKKRWFQKKETTRSADASSSNSSSEDVEILSDSLVERQEDNHNYHRGATQLLQMHNHPSKNYQNFEPIVETPAVVGVRNTVSNPEQASSPKQQQQQQHLSNKNENNNHNILQEIPGPKKKTKGNNNDDISCLDEQSLKQIIKERDGFCRRVDKYDGSVITVEGQAAYEIGNYLGGGVAGVVYEGHRLLPEYEYPVREMMPTPKVIETKSNQDFQKVHSLLSCAPSCYMDNTIPNNNEIESNNNRNDYANEYQNHTADANLTMMIRDNPSMIRDDGSLLTMESFRNTQSLLANDDIALETVDDTIIVDDLDGANRTRNMARAAINQNDFETASFTNTYLEETVAIKILNPVGFRTLAPDVTNSAVVARKGKACSSDILAGKAPMTEEHVWWLINPSSRNLRTLQRYSIDTQTPRGVEVDRGKPERGLRISLIAAYQDKSGKIKELPLTRCIEIWGHVPFDATDAEFKEIMDAIERINQGLPPPEIPPGRVATATSSEDLLHNAKPLTTQRT
jgi:hypothetical protein